MRPVRSLLIYIGMVFVGGALLAPWLYWSVQGFAVWLPALDELVWKLMQKRPEDRPPSASAVLKEIELLRGAATMDIARQHSADRRRL